MECYLNKHVDKNECSDLDDFLSLCHATEKLLDNKLFCAESGSYVHPGDFGVLGTVLMSCKDYGQSIDLGYRYQHLINERLWREPVHQGSTVISRIDDKDFEAVDVRPYVEMEFAMLVHISHFLTGRMYSSTPATLNFKHKPQASAERYAEVFRTDILFEQEYNQIKMHEIMLEAPIYAANDQLLKLLLGQVKELELTRGKEQSFVNRVMTYIHANIVHGVPKLEDCAQAFHMSVSTFKRRLQDADTSFQDVLDHVRFSVAKNMLANSEMNLNEVSCLLGFSKSSAFSRAFKRWSGLTPKQFQNS